MFHDNHKTRIPLFKQLVILFLLFLLIPTIGFVFIFQSIVTNEITSGKTEADRESLELLCGYSDIIIDRAWSNAVRLSTDPRIKELFDLQTSMITGNIKYVDAVLETKQMMRTLSATDNSVHSVYLLNNDTGLLVTSLGETITATEYLDRDWLVSYDADVNKLSILPARKPVSKNLKKSHYIDVDRDVSSTVITMILPLIFDPEELLDGAVIINILESELFPPVSEEKDVSYVLMDSNAMVISSGESADLVSALENAMPDIISKKLERGNLELQLTDRNMMVSFIRSGSNGIFFLKVRNLTSILMWIGRLRMLILLFSLSLFIFGMLVARFIAKRITTPIKSTITLLEKSLEQQPSELGENELKRIQTAVSGIVEENRKIRDFLSNQEAGTQNRLAFDLIRGRLENADLLFPHSEKSIVCLLIGINNFREFSENYSYQQQYAIKKLILEFALKAAQNRTAAAGVIMQHEKIALLIQIPDESELSKNFNASLDEFKKRIMEDILEASCVADEISTSVSMGGIYEDLSSVRLSFLEAVEALNYRIGSSDENFIDFTKLPQPPKHLPNIEILVDNLLNCLEFGEKTEIPAMVNRIIKKLTERAVLNYRMIQEGLLPLVAKTIEFLRDRDLYDGDAFTGRQKSLFDLIAEQETQRDLRNALVAYYLPIYNFLNKSDREEGLTERILSYIKNQHTNPNLDLTMVAGLVGLSYSHTRKIIKDSTGLSFIDYLNRIRIAEGKNLLLEAGLSVRQVAGETGYHNEQSFSRFFKKYEGITPGEYKRRRNLNTGRK